MRFLIVMLLFFCLIFIFEWHCLGHGSPQFNIALIGYTEVLHTHTLESGGGGGEGGLISQVKAIVCNPLNIRNSYRNDTV